MIPLEIAGQTSYHKSVQFSSELTRNMYLDKSETTGKLGAHDFPGLKAFSTGTGAGRGEHVMNGVRYVINGGSLIKEISTGLRTNLGSVAGTDRAVFADDGANLFFTASNNIYHYDGSTLSTVSQTVVTNPASIAYINQQIIIHGDNQEFAISDVDDGTTYNALNYDFEKSKPDEMRRVFVYQNLIYMCGAESIVPWRNTGVGNPPLARQETALVNTGIAGKHAVTASDSYMYVFSDDRRLLQIIGGTFRSVITTGISHTVEGFSTVSDCVASSFVWRGQTFVMLKFPTAGACLVYSETYKYWIELSSGTNKNSRVSWYGDAVQRCFDKLLVTDYRNGNTYELDEDTYTDNGDTRLRIMVLPSFTSKLIQRPGRRILVKQLRVLMQKGVGLATGQGSDPVLMCDFSVDGGHTWQAESFVNIGQMGNYVTPVDFYDFANGYEVKSRIMISDPVPISMWGIEVDIVDGGH